MSNNVHIEDSAWTDYNGVEASLPEHVQNYLDSVLKDVIELDSNLSEICKRDTNIAIIVKKMFLNGYIRGQQNPKRCLK